jgi:3-oxoacyl-[acyl-carrier protein] reductase
MDEAQRGLCSKRILVTGVSRAMGIGAAIAKALAKEGATVLIHGYAPYDQALAYPDAAEAYALQLAETLQGDGLCVQALQSSDLSRAEAPEAVIREAADKVGYLDGLVLNHAYSTHAPLGTWTAAHIDSHLQTNVRAAMLMIQAFSRQLPVDVTAAITLFTSGQYLGPMTEEIAYAVSKDAIIGLCRQAAAVLAPKGVRVNCVNPGPTDTGYLQPDSERYQEVAHRFPLGRWGTPEDVARLVLFLHSDMAAWITGQTIASEGGFQRYAQG